MPVRQIGWAVFIFLILAALAEGSTGRRFLERHPGNWRFTYLPDGRIEMLYGDYVAPPDAPGGSSVQAVQKDPVQLALGFFEAEREFFAPGVTTDQLTLSRLKQSMAGQHLSLQQTHHGYVVDNAFFEVHLTPDGRVFHVNNSLVVTGASLYAATLSAAEATEVARDFLVKEQRTESSNRSSPKALNSSALEHMVKQIRQARAGSRERRDIPVARDPELVFYAIGNELRLVWKVMLIQALDRHMQLHVDAATGNILSCVNLVSHFRSGEGKIYRENPVVTPRLEVQQLPNLDESGFLKGRYAEVYVFTGKDDKGFSEGKLDAQSASGAFQYEPSDPRLTEVNVYYHTNVAHGYFKSQFGFAGLDLPVPSFVRMPSDLAKGDISGAYHSPLQGSLNYGIAVNNVDLGLDAWIVYHEYTHAVVDKIKQLGRNVASHSEGRGMNEGFSEYFAGVLTGDTCLGEYAIKAPTSELLQLNRSSQSCVIDLRTRKRHPEDATFIVKDSSGKFLYLGAEEHLMGEIWAAGLWDLRIVLGAAVADRLVFQSIYLLPERDARFSHGLIALLSADQQLNGGVNAARIREVLNARGIFESDRFPMLLSGEGEDGFFFLFGVLPGVVAKGLPFIPGSVPGQFFNGRTYLLSGVALPASLQAVRLLIVDSQGNVANGIESGFDSGPLGDAVAFIGTIKLTNVAPGDYSFIVAYSSDKTNFKFLEYKVRIDNLGPPAKVFGPGPPPPPDKPQIASVTPAQIVQGSKTELVVRGSGFKGSKVSLAISPDAGLQFETGKLESESQITAQYTVTDNAPTGARDLAVVRDGVSSNVVKISVVEKSQPVIDILPEQKEKEPNDEAVEANTVKGDALVSGSIDPAGDLDVYVFEGRANTNFAAEIYAQRLGSGSTPGSQLDSVVALFDQNLELLTFNDDIDLDGGVYDSALYYKLEKDGKYYLLVLDASLLEDEDEGAGGPQHFYKLRLSDASSALRDSTPPAKPVLNVPTVINKTTTLGASWTAFDLESGISGYRYAIGATAGGEQIKSFTFTSNGSFYLSDLNLTPGGTYYVSVRAVNGAGLLSETAVSTAIRVDTSAAVRRLIFPRMISNKKEFTGMALANGSAQKTEAVFTAFNNVGRAISGPRITNPKTLELGAGEQKARLEREIFNLAFGSQEQTGWVEVALSTPQATGFYLFGDNDLTFLHGADVQAATVKDFVLPRILKRTGAFTEISIVNPSNTAAELSLEIYDTEGTKRESKTLRLDPRARYFGNVAFLFDISGYTPGYIRGRSAQGVVAFEIFGDARAIGGLNALDLTAAATRLYVAQLGSGSGFFTEIALVNPNSSPVTVEINARDDDGNLMPGALSASVTRTIAANGYLSATAQTLFGLPGRLVAGYVEVVVRSGGGVVGSVTFGTDDGEALASLPIQPAGKRAITLSHVAQTADFFTGVTLLNPTANPIAATVSVFDSNGKLVGSANLELKARQKIARLIHEWVPAAANQAGGYIKVSSSENIFCFELFGRSNLKLLSAVPAQ